MARDVRLSEDFKQEFRKLRKRRKHIATDFTKLLKKFDNNALPGKNLRGAGSLSFKSVRMSDRSSNRGSRGGFRITYKYTCTTVLLLRIVPRNEEDYIAPWRLKKLAEQYGCECDHTA